ncbi:MAG: UTP--glucose-1-phosphate uridylyltransferase [Candidatus Cyclobacteriaceae bacterium M3_2C_046]
MNILLEAITSSDPEIRNTSFFELASRRSYKELLADIEGLDQFRQQTPNLYDKVRASLFIYAAYRFFLVQSDKIPSEGTIPFKGFENLLERRFEKAIEAFKGANPIQQDNGTIFSALAESYHHLTFQYLIDQVKKSVRSSRGNQWMFRVGHQDEHAIRIHPTLMNKQPDSLFYPLLEEKTSVRMDLSHSGWSDIFFLGMDYPEGARVVNVSINLGVYGRDKEIVPPIATYFRVIPEPVIRLTSIDLDTTKDITDLSDLFNFGNDYLSLLKAGVIASGLIPPSFEGTNQSLQKILSRIAAPGMGFELVTKVNDIPKGSRFAVSTNLLGSMITLMMRASCQTERLEGGLMENERRLVASRAILGEWLGGSGGGWQDSGGVWPGIKIIKGALAGENDPEYGVSRGCLLPNHQVLAQEELAPDIYQQLTKSLVLFHGGMAQNVGPILEMVTEKYLLRSGREWEARLAAREIFDNIIQSLKDGDIRKLAANTSRNWEYPIKTIIPWVSNYFTESIIEQAKKEMGADYYGFLMLGGMSGGGMGLFVNPDKYNEAKDKMLKILTQTKQSLADSLPFAIDPVVYNFSINDRGTEAFLHQGNNALLPSRYYALQLPDLVKKDPEYISYIRKAEIDYFTQLSDKNNQAYPLLRTVVSNLFRVSDPSTHKDWQKENQKAESIKKENGFDQIQHENIREDLLSGRIGLSRNRLPAETFIEDVQDQDVTILNDIGNLEQLGQKALKEGKVGVYSLAAGVGSRWTRGAGVIKAINPFVEIEGKHRDFLEIHLAKTKKTAAQFQTKLPHIVATSYLTHAPIQNHLEAHQFHGYDGPVYFSPGRSLGQRFIPMVRDLMFLWEEMPQETLDEQKQKVRDSVRKALLDWARSKGEAADYSDNIALQRFSPLGHWYEVSNLFRNGTLARVLEQHPDLQTLMLHNIDTLGADLSASALGYHLDAGNVLTFEVVPRRIEDRGGGLARVNGKVRLLEGLAQPREEDELDLRYYNSMTTWIQIDPLLEIFGLNRQMLKEDPEIIAKAVRNMAARMPTYVTIKDVKYRWGHGQEDIYPVAQIEKLWSDMTALPDIKCGYLVVPRLRGQQMKDPDQLDEWANDGSKEFVKGLGLWG